ncbi:UDP-3-O-[3-hydroxymyristoyl] N-acetylglucosamine deacetylase [Candidatus Sumerlaeota bacterium]|nr:UDP-3-O-[3-hydroxymyristoyl] N-acetylglucosamine deacetylase [Candidatus Sumerlaeota bacterium]
MNFVTETSPVGTLVRDSGIPTRTIAKATVIEGTGIHSGTSCRVHIQPRDAGEGIAFTRAGRTPVPATWKFADAQSSDRRTVIIGADGERFEQIEHLMAALHALGISDALVEQQGPEVPFLGGGSREYIDALRQSGITENGGILPVIHIEHPISLEDGGALLTAAPHNGLILSAYVEFPGTVVGNMGYNLEVSPERFYDQVSAARTFALASDIEALRSRGLARGGNLQNAVVFDEFRYHNESLHFPDEVARHKIIDLLGDLALLGCGLSGHFWAWRAGHRSHVLFAQKIARGLHLTS